jgi:hypothetical protein
VNVLLVKTKNIGDAVLLTTARAYPSLRPHHHAFAGPDPAHVAVDAVVIAAAFKSKSTFAFTLQVKPGKFQNPFHGPIGSASVDFQPFFNCGI